VAALFLVSDVSDELNCFFGVTKFFNSVFRSQYSVLAEGFLWTYLDLEVWKETPPPSETCVKTMYNNHSLQRLNSYSVTGG
jgi:hypothetical protein